MHLLRLPAVLERTGMSRTRLYASLAKGDFPRPVKLGSSPSSRAIGFVESEIDAWINARIAEREAA